mmetsp:Transcript_45135/g.61585  ORF Transcript_45135/g.61585 Transcript_45135/m.61585 type:complete len:212 (-) Transcript_45135:19-654(-)
MESMKIAAGPPHATPMHSRWCTALERLLPLLLTLFLRPRPAVPCLRHTCAHRRASSPPPSPTAPETSRSPAPRPMACCWLYYWTTGASPWLLPRPSRCTQHPGTGSVPRSCGHGTAPSASRKTPPNAPPHARLPPPTAAAAGAVVSSTETHGDSETPHPTAPRPRPNAPLLLPPPSCPTYRPVGPTTSTMPPCPDPPEGGCPCQPTAVPAV